MTHIDVLQALREQRLKALKDALELRGAGVGGAPAASLRGWCRGLIREIRAIEAALGYIGMAETHELMLQTVDFYANPESYFAIGFFPDRPCGDFIDDFSETEDGFKPGKQAREALEAFQTLIRKNL